MTTTPFKILLLPASPCGCSEATARIWWSQQPFSSLPSSAMRLPLPRVLALPHMRSERLTRQLSVGEFLPSSCQYSLSLFGTCFAASASCLFPFSPTLSRAGLFRCSTCTWRVTRSHIRQLKSLHSTGRMVEADVYGLLSFAPKGTKLRILAKETLD